MRKSEDIGFLSRADIVLLQQIFMSDPFHNPSFSINGINMNHLYV